MRTRIKRSCFSQGLQLKKKNSRHRQSRKECAQRVDESRPPESDYREEEKKRTSGERSATIWQASRDPAFRADSSLYLPAGSSAIGQ